MGRFKAVVFDWAGTIIDFGSFAPMGAFQRAFAEFGIQISIAQARAPMGAAKWNHVRAILEMPEVAAQWQAAHGKAPDAAAIRREVPAPFGAVVASDRWRAPAGRLTPPGCPLLWP